MAAAAPALAAATVCLQQQDHEHQRSTGIEQILLSERAAAHP
jgi:hypothetical protein